MRKRLALVLAVIGTAALVGFVSAHSVARAQEPAKKYRIAFTFDGLVTFVPFDRPTNGTTAAALWVLSPAVDQIDTVVDQADSRRNDKRFRPKDGHYVAHHTLLCAPAAELTSTSGGEGRLLTVLDGGLHDLELEGALGSPAAVTIDGIDALPQLLDAGSPARVCRGCIGTDLPESLPYGATVPLGFRMAFTHGETLSIAWHMNARWRYSKDDSHSLRRLPASVTVTSKELTGPAALTIKTAGTRHTMRLPISPPALGDTVEFRIRNEPAADMFDPHVAHVNVNLVKEAPLEHFRLGYLLAPKASVTGHPYDYNYEDYVHPVILPQGPMDPPRPFCRALTVTYGTQNGDPFCTAPSKGAP